MQGECLMQRECITKGMYKGEGKYITTTGMNGRDVQLYIPRSTGVYTSRGGRQCKDIIYKYGLYGSNPILFGVYQIEI